MTWPKSDHFDGRRFFNPHLENARPLSAVPRMLTEPRAPWPPRVPVQVRDVDPRPAEAWASLTFVGHSTFVIQTPKGTVITDPVFAERASPVSFAGPRRVREAAVRLDRLPHIDLVLLSHNHYDHCDLASLRHIARRFSPALVTPLGNGKLARQTGFTRIDECDWWGTSSHAPLPVTVTPARHFSARTPFDRNEALWGGFVLQVGPRRLYVAGDSGHGPHFGEIRQRLGAMDCALLPIGAYEPRWFMSPIHMNPDEAAQAHLAVDSRLSIGKHYGTFQLTSEAIDEPLRALAHARRIHGIPDDRFTTLDFGETRHLID